MGSPEVYRWSSAREHVKGSSDGIVSQRCYLLEETSDGRRYLQEEEEGNLVSRLRISLKKSSGLIPSPSPLSPPLKGGGEPKGLL
jgi:hypothetical protein